MSEMFKGKWQQQGPQQETILLWQAESPDALYYDVFAEFALGWLDHPDIRIMQKDAAADSFCWVFEWRSTTFLLNYEEMSQSCWVSVTREPDQALLTQLLAWLNQY